MNKKKIPIGVLWKRKDKKGILYMTGLVGIDKVIIFKNKKDNSKQPDLIIYKN